MEEPLSPAGMRGALKQWFGFDDFRPGQEEVVADVLAGHDTLAIMPTGAGKSLCYQLPSMLLPGATLVISPLIALMKDQYDNLPPEIYEKSTFINSSLDPAEAERRLQSVVDGKIKLIYAAPERLRQQPFLHALRRANLSLLVVDEVHCLSLWGHDFRPDYLFIGPSLKALGEPRVLGMTATATQEIAGEIGRQLGREMRLVQTSPFRPNLFYGVIQLADQKEKTRTLLRLCRDEKGSGIVYARSRDRTEALAAQLRRAGVKAAHYHAGLGAEERSRVQEDWMLDRTRVIVATIAFGMGIDKANVRFIVHFSPPDSLESYAQESGRAGRDGRPARCILLTTPGDRANLTRWLHAEQIHVERLRDLYGALRKQTPATNVSVPLSMGRLAQDAGGDGVAEAAETELRVGIGMMERVGLLVRHADAPSTAQVGVPMLANGNGDAIYANFLQAAELARGQQTTIMLADVATALKLGPHELEARLLDWRDAGLVTLRSGQRQPVVERLPPPRDTRERMEEMLKRYDEAQMHRVDDLTRYTNSPGCHHQTLARHLGHTIPPCGDRCDNCVKGRSAPAAQRIEQTKQDLAPLLAALQEATALLAGRDVNPAHAALILECVAALPYPVAKTNVAKIMQGAADAPFKVDQVSQYGALRDIWPSEVSRQVNALLELGFLRSVAEGGKNLVYLGRPKDIGAASRPSPVKGPASAAGYEPVEEVEGPRLPDNPALIMLECIASLPITIGRTNIAKILAGSNAAIFDANRCRHFGALSMCSQQAIADGLLALKDAGYLQFQQYNDFPVLALTEKWLDEPPAADLIKLPYKAGVGPEAEARRAEREQRRQAELATAERVNRQSVAQPVRGAESDDRFERLRAWRRATAAAEGVPPYIVFYDVALHAIADSRVETVNDLLALPGIGPAKAAKYGQQILDLLLDAAGENEVIDDVEI